MLERVSYRRTPPGPPADPEAARWEEIRREFFFRSWAPGVSQLELSVLLCLSCGAVVFTPRPTRHDIEQKYEALRALGVGPGATAVSAHGRELDRGRSELLLALVAARGERSTEDPRVLDVGGGDGKLMRAFTDAGWTSFVVDYNTEPLPGVTRLGDTLADVPASARFDAIVCAHVLEHVVDPLSLARQMAALLEPAGRLYAEIPLEIWRGTPIEADPLTHLNYFTGASLARLLQTAGLTVLAARERWATYGESVLEVAHAVAVISDGTRGVAGGDPVRAVARRLDPSLHARARRRASVRRAIRAAARA